MRDGIKMVLNNTILATNSSCFEKRITLKQWQQQPNHNTNGDKELSVKEEKIKNITLK